MNQDSLSNRSAEKSTPENQIFLYNSYTREREEFQPISPDQVRIYSCGPTVYNYAHIGNLRAYIFTDTLRRMMQWKNHNLLHVINITDVGHLTSDEDEGDDKIELAARKKSISAWEIAEHYTSAFKEDLKNLNILDPSLFCVATDHIQDMINYLKNIHDKGFAYELDTGLYFDTSKVSSYGWLARSDVSGQEAGSRVQGPTGKRNKSDFALWRRSAKDENRQMEWDSPWGRGAPGWHIECSVMSMKYLGHQFDIHTGGIDHREIHHCNEIAQNQAYTGSCLTGAGWWMHNAFLTDKTEKMSKSSASFLRLVSLVERGIHPLAYRLRCLATHYRSDMEFSLESLLAALVRLRRLYGKMEELRGNEDKLTQQITQDLGELAYSKGASFAFQRKRIELDLPERALNYLNEFDREISSDLGMPKALTILEEVAFETNIDTTSKLRLIASFDLVMGLDLMSLSRSDLRIKPKSSMMSEDDIENKLRHRSQLRADKMYKDADAIREELDARGVELLDGDPLKWLYKIDVS